MTDERPAGAQAAIDRDALAAVAQPHAMDAQDVLAALAVTPRGLNDDDVRQRLATFGPNELPRARGTSLLGIILHQFKSPLIYLLLVAAAVALAAGEVKDAILIGAVLLVNALIGTIQEYGAERSAEALANLVPGRTVVRRNGREATVDAVNLVPGDVVILEAGAKVPADLRLIDAASVESDESLLTGESLAVEKDAAATTSADTTIGDRHNMLFGGSLITRGRAEAVVTQTGAATQLGSLASSLGGSKETRPPLLQRMDRFANGIAIAIGVVSIILAIILKTQGSDWAEVILVCVALAVAAIPEGLPIGLTVALSLATRRMSARNVIARRLVAVEALGSCTFIASDKTGTLTLNELTTTRIAVPGEPAWELTGSGIQPEGELVLPGDDQDPARELALRLSRTATLCNDGTFEQRDGEWTHLGDAVDVALLVLGHKVGQTRESLERDAREVDRIPFDPDLRFAASVRDYGDKRLVHVKGAPEQLLDLSATMATRGGDVPLDRDAITRQADELAAAGFRVLAYAEGPAPDGGGRIEPGQLGQLTFLGLTAMIDPLRPEARDAVAACRDAGIEVAMVTGDHPVTALAICRDLGLADREDQVVTGKELRAAVEQGPEAVRELVRDARVFARVEPAQKLLIVETLAELGHFVAVTGDGANDAPALKRGHVGVAMAQRGTDVAREASTLIVTDDNFASIVSGIEEGRVAYNNVRKVTFLLVGTGATSVLMFLAVIALGLPIPLVAVQLLWLNLVTNGIQDVALAFEPGEGDELKARPRRPNESIFDRLMIERVLVTALVMAPIVTFAFWWMKQRADYDLDEARNMLLLMFVVFGNILVGAARSERHAVLQMSPLRNPVLIGGTLAATGLHILCMHLPGISDALGIAPLPPHKWAIALGVALLPFIALELHKLIRFRGDYLVRRAP